MASVWLVTNLGGSYWNILCVFHSLVVHNFTCLKSPFKNI